MFKKKKKDDYVSYADAVAKLNKKKSMFTEEELSKLAPSSKSSTAKPSTNQRTRIITKRCVRCDKSLDKNSRICGYCKAINIYDIDRVLLLVVFTLLIFWMLSDGDEKRIQQPVYIEKTAKQIRTESVNSQFSSWDGSHRKLERLVKNMMKDPSSFDHISTKYWMYDNFILVKMIYRGKNSFNATVINTIIAKYSIDGRLIEVQSQ